MPLLLLLTYNLLHLNNYYNTKKKFMIEILHFS